MKTKGRRQSKNVEIRPDGDPINNAVTPEMWYSSNEPFVRRAEQEMKGHFSEHLRDKRRIKEQPLTDTDVMVNTFLPKQPESMQLRKRKETAKPTKFQKKK